MSRATLWVAVAAMLLPLAGACKPPQRSAPELEDTTFGAPQRVTIRGYSGEAMEPFMTRDGRFLLFNTRNDPGVNTDLHYARAVDALTFDYGGPLRGANSQTLDAVASVDRSGTMYFISPRSYETTLSTIYRGAFADGAVTGVGLVEGLPRKPGVVLFDVEVTADGSALYYASGTFRGGQVPTSADLVIGLRRGAAFEPWQRSGEVLVRVNTSAALEYAAGLSPDGNELFFTRFSGSLPAIYRATRSGNAEPFGTPARIAAIRGFAEAPTISPDGRRVYYHASVNGRFAIFCVLR